MLSIETIRAADPAQVATSLEAHLRDTDRRVFRKPHDRRRSSETIYWLTRYAVPRAHFLAKGAVMPYEPPGEARQLLVGFYVEKGAETAGAVRGEHLVLTSEWDWHTVTAKPAKLDAALNDARERGGPLRLLLRTSIGTVHFSFDQELEVVTDEGGDVSHCGAAKTVEQLLAVLQRTPGIEDAHVDLVIGHSFARGIDTGLTAAQLDQRSLKPWRQWIWSESSLLLNRADQRL